MSQRFFSVLAVALLVAAAASFVLYRLMAHPVEASAPSVPVVVAARDLDPGTLLKEADLKIEQRPGSLPAGAARETGGLVGRGVRAAIYRDEVVVDNRLAPQGAGAGMAAMIPEGMRAVAVRVNDVVGVAGFALPGMRVDVLVSGNPPGGAETGSMTRTVLQNIQVLSAGHNFRNDTEGKPVSAQVVNLLVTPEQAEVLSLASHHATIQLVLRNPLDARVAHPPGAALASLYAGVRPAAAVRSAPSAPRRTVPPAPAPPPPPPVVVEMIHGVKRTEQRFPRGAP